MTRPALTGIAVELAGTDINRTYPRDLPDLFEGGQLAWVGRYRRSGPATVKLTGKVGGDRQSFEFPADLAAAGSGSGRDFVEKLWAVRRIGSIIDQIDLDGPNKELTDELVALSTRYGVLTPYTSFLADERVNLHARVENAIRCAEDLNGLSVVQGQFGTTQRMAKQVYNKADRFGEAIVAYAPSEAAKPAGGGFAGGGGGTGASQTKSAGGGFGGGIGAGQAMSPAQPGLASLPQGAYLVNPFVDHSFGRRTPIVVGTSGGGQQNSTGNLAVPHAQGGALAIAPFNAVPTRRAEPGQNVRQIGTKTFFRKANRWVDAEVGAEQEAKAVAVEQFSDEFFKLARDQAADQNQYLSLDEPVTVLIAGCAYKIDPPKAR